MDEKILDILGLEDLKKHRVRLTHGNLSISHLSVALQLPIDARFLRSLKHKIRCFPMLTPVSVRAAENLFFRDKEDKVPPVTGEFKVVHSFPMTSAERRVSHTTLEDLADIYWHRSPLCLEFAAQMSEKKEPVSLIVPRPLAITLFKEVLVHSRAEFAMSFIIVWTKPPISWKREINGHKLSVFFEREKDKLWIFDPIQKPTTGQERVLQAVRSWLQEALRHSVGLERGVQPNDVKLSCQCNPLNLLRARLLVDHIKPETFWKWKTGAFPKKTKTILFENLVMDEFGEEDGEEREYLVVE